MKRSIYKRGEKNERLNTLILDNDNDNIFLYGRLLKYFHHVDTYIYEGDRSPYKYRVQGYVYVDDIANNGSIHLPSGIQVSYIDQKAIMFMTIPM